MFSGAAAPKAPPHPLKRQKKRTTLTFPQMHFLEGKAEYADAGKCMGYDLIPKSLSAFYLSLQALYDAPQFANLVIFGLEAQFIFVEKVQRYVVFEPIGFE